MNPVCNICGNNTSKIFDAILLQKYLVNYFQCTNCEFIQTEKPYWLNEAYTSAMTSLDVGLVFRNVQFSNTLPSILDLFSGIDDAYLDYGGGYGMFVRMMRDKGYDFYLYDKYADNLFAKHFELNDFSTIKKFKALTAFEVFEHLESPIEDLKKMFALSDTIIFSTELQPQQSFEKFSDWWYFMPEVGQHISFYSKKSLENIASLFECNVYTNGINLHILSRQWLKADPFNAVQQKQGSHSLLSRVVRKFSRPTIDILMPARPSLLPKDFELYKGFVLKEDGTETND